MTKKIQTSEVRNFFSIGPNWTLKLYIFLFKFYFEYIGIISEVKKWNW